MTTTSEPAPTDPSTRPQPGAGTRTRLIRAGERLFATRGIDAVSLREITRSASQANVSALQYHFGDRVGLLRAIMAKHGATTEPRRHALLDQYEARGHPDVRDLAAALVLPLAAKLADPDGGREYLRIVCDIYTRTDRTSIERLVPFDNPQHSMRRWHRLLDPLMSPEETSARRSRYPAMRFAFVEFARRAAATPREDDSLFTSHMTDLVTALLTAPPSAETRRLLSS